MTIVSVLAGGRMVCIKMHACERSCCLFQGHLERFGKQRVAMTTNLRALASMMDVEDTQIPPTGTDRGTPWAWRTRNLIGDEVAYGEGPVARGTDIVGQAVADGVLAPVRRNPEAGCRGLSRRDASRR